MNELLICWSRLKWNSCQTYVAKSPSLSKFSATLPSDDSGSFAILGKGESVVMHYRTCQCCKMKGESIGCIFVLVDIVSAAEGISRPQSINERALYK